MPGVAASRASASMPLKHNRRAQIEHAARSAASATSMHMSTQYVTTGNAPQQARACGWAGEERCSSKKPASAREHARQGPAPAPLRTAASTASVLNVDSWSPKVSRRAARTSLQSSSA